MHGRVASEPVHTAHIITAHPLSAQWLQHMHQSLLRRDPSRLLVPNSQELTVPATKASS